MLSKPKTEYTFIGWVNAWETNKAPKQYYECKNNNHPLIRDTVGTCLNDYYCEICMTCYSVDSSD